MIDDDDDDVVVRHHIGKMGWYLQCTSFNFPFFEDGDHDDHDIDADADADAYHDHVMMIMMIMLMIMMVSSYWEDGLVSAVELIQVFLSEKKLMISLSDV